MMKALRRRHTGHIVRAGAWTAGTTLAMWPAAGSAPARAASATTATTSVSAIGPGGVHLRAWVSQAPPGAPTLIVVNGGPGNSHLDAPPAGELLRKFRVAFYDQRGTGQSSTPRDGAIDVPQHPRRAEPAQRYRGHVLLVFGQQDARRPVSQHLDRDEVPSAHVQVKVLPHSGHDTWIEN